jgi:hypothetical protein
VKKFYAIAGALAVLVSAGSAELIGWETNCEGTDGWYDNKADAGMGTEVSQFETGVIAIKQSGNDTWGKAAFSVENIDLDKTPILEIKVNQVEEGAGFQVKIVPKDWSEMISVVERSNGEGIYKANIQKAISKQSVNPAAYASPATFSVVVIVEGKGKSVWVDNVEIRSE